MPFPSVLLVRTALCWLAAGVAMGALLLASKAAPLPAGVLRLFHAHSEAVLVGWMVQFAMGVAWWILPKYPRLPERGPAAPVWAAWLLLNVGVVLAGVGRSVGASEGLVMAGRMAEALAAAVFAAGMWPRVKAFGQ
jgi:uncharacterized membrane protein YidH (DUF202 family)